MTEPDRIWINDKWEAYLRPTFEGDTSGYVRADLADPAAIREAALREAADVCAGIRQRIADGPMPEGARFDYEQAILALITEKPHDRA